MCVIVTAEPGCMPSMVELSLMAERNPDSAGIAWHDPQRGRVVVKKFLDTNEALGFIGSHYNQLENVACLIHFRIATNGAVNLTNCHPFCIHGGVVAHNGVACDYVNGPYSSDSRNVILAWDRDRSLDLSGQGKFAYLGDDGEIVWLAGGIVLRHGITVSNMLWRPAAYYHGVSVARGMSSAGNFEFGSDDFDDEADF